MGKRLVECRKLTGNEESFKDIVRPNHIETITPSMKLTGCSAQFVMETPSVTMAERLNEDEIKIANAKYFFVISENNTDTEQEVKHFF